MHELQRSLKFSYAVTNFANIFLDMVLYTIIERVQNRLLSNQKSVEQKESKDSFLEIYWLSIDAFKSITYDRFLEAS